MTIFIKKKFLCALPNNQLLNFDRVLKRVNRLPLVNNGLGQSLTVEYKHNSQNHRLTARTSILQLGVKGGPLVIFIPWFGGRSINLKRFLSLKRRPTWTLVGIDAFHDPKGLNQVLYLAEGSRHAYALVISLLTRLIESARQEGRKVGVVGLSYGANIINAYLSRGLDVPDAIVAIEGGSIIETTLHGKWKCYQYDPKVLEALSENPALVPTQKPTEGKAAEVSLAAINKTDKVVLCQEYIWQNAKTKLYINGPHFMAPILNQRKIHIMANTHLGNLLS